MSSLLTSVDACYPQNMADGGHDVYLSYCDGLCAFQPNPLGRPVKYIISSLATNQGSIGDVEPGNPFWDRWVPWVQQRRAAGNDPTLYCCDDGFGSNFFDGWRHADGVVAFARAGVPEPHWWVFNFNKSYVPSYAVANQVSDNIGPGWDLSLVQDAGWPGVIDPLPLEKDMFLFRNDDDGGIHVVGEFTVTHIPDTGTAGVYQAVLPVEHGHSIDLSELQNQAARAMAIFVAALPAGGGGLTPAQAAQLADIQAKVDRDLA